MSDDFGLWDVFLSMFWFMLLFAWIWMLIAIFGDIFRDHELSGWGKALWSLGIIVLPWLGVLIYLIARGSSMTQRSVRAAQENEQHFRAYVREAAAPASPSEELRKLAELRDSGAITPADYDLAKAKVLS